MIRIQGNYLAICFCVGAVVVGGCATLARTSARLPEDFTVHRGQLVVHSGFPLAANHRLLEELVARRADLQDQLHLAPSDEPIHIYLFEKPEEFREFVRLRHPDFPLRRAFFLETDTLLQIYAQWGERIGEDLRHEVTHGYLHSMVPNIPLWLDEGLAEYGEAPRGQHGLNHEHMEHIRHEIREGRWRPDLVRLEGLDPAGDLTQSQYAESWAWAHFLLETTPARVEVLRAYLAELRQKATTEPISARLARLDGDSALAIVAHMRELLDRKGIAENQANSNTEWIADAGRPMLVSVARR